MPYRYEEMKPEIFTDIGVNKILEIYTKICQLPDTPFKAQDVFVTGDSWLMLAVLDYLVEKGYIKEIYTPADTFAQNRKFIK